MTKMQQADKEIAAYDAFIFGAVGRVWDAAAEQKATVLAFYAEQACSEAAADRSEPDWFRAQYKQQAEFFKAIQ